MQDQACTRFSVGILLAFFAAFRTAKAAAQTERKNLGAIYFSPDARELIAHFAGDIAR